MYKNIGTLTQRIIMGLTPQQLKTLGKLCRCKSSKTRKQILNEGGNHLQHAIRECSYNVLKGVVPLSTKQKKALKKHSAGVRNLAKRNTTHKKRLAIEQKGGFLFSLLAPVLTSIVGGVISAVKGK